MKLQSSDTNPKIEKLLVEMIRSLSTSQRISKSLSLTSSMIYLSKRAIRRANPDKNKSELDLLFVKLHYGSELADKLKLFLEEHHND